MFSELENCCNATSPCNIGQGDCDTDDDCIGNLVCGKQNCGPGFFWDSTDCCTTLVGLYFLIIFACICTMLYFNFPEYYINRINIFDRFD